MEVLIALAKDTGSVFHGTSLNAMYSIAKDNKLLLSQVAGKEAEERFAKQPFFLSVRRNRLITHNSYSVTIEFKEQMLHSKMKRESVDYWGATDKGTSIEQEDRYYYAKPNLPEILKYIRAVHFDLQQYDPERFGPRMRELLIRLVKSGIRVYLYEDNKAYKYLDTRKTVPISSMKYGKKAASVFVAPAEEDAEEIAYQQRRKMYQYKSDKNSDIKQVLDFLLNRAERTEDNSYLYDRFKYQWNQYDLYGQLKNIVHNASHGTEREKKLAARLGAYMRDNNKTIQEIADQIRVKLGGQL